jgi:hypothetical protein
MNIKIRIKYLLLLLFVGLCAPFFCNAQWEEGQINVHFSIPEIALIDIEPSFNNSVHFSITTSAEPGESPNVNESSDQELWINYSSAMKGENNSRKIVAEIVQGSLPDGIELFLEASVYKGTGEGNFGEPIGRVNIGTQPRPIIAGIGSCYTGDGINNGHLLQFSIEISDYSKIHSGSESEFTILYTITDN